MGHGLAHGGPAHETLDPVPRPGPLHAGGDVPGRRDPVPHRGDGLGEAALVVGPQLGQPGLQAHETVLVGGQHLGGLVALQALQGAKEVPQGVGSGLGVEGDVGGDAGQDVVAREHEGVAGLPEAEVAGGVAGSPDGHEVPTGHLGLVAVLDHQIGLDRGDEGQHGHGGALQ